MTVTHPAFRCCGVRVDALALDEACAEILRTRYGDSGRSVHLCNAYTLSLARSDAAFREVVNGGDLNLADGSPVAWIGRHLGYRAMKSGPVRGADLLRAVTDHGRSSHTRHYFCGSTDVVVKELITRLEEHSSGIVIVGHETDVYPRTSNSDLATIFDSICAAAPDLVWVGLGTPFQDQFIEHLKQHIPATVVAIGAAFDYVAGHKPEAPRWMRGGGLEWIFRLASEPRRLWRRYVFGNITFFRGLVRGEFERM